MDLEVTVVIPARNAARFLAETLVSVVRQEFKPRQIIVVDDASTDDTARIAREFVTQGVQLISGTGSGAATALNIGIAAASTELIAHFDADDIMLPKKLKRQLEPFRSVDAQQLAFVTSDLQMFDEQSDDKHTFLERRHLLHNHSATLSAGGFLYFQPGDAFSHLCREHCLDVKGIYRKSVWKEVGGFDSTLRCAYDLDFVSRIAQRHAIAVLPEVLYRGRRHSSNLSGASELVARECIEVFQRMRRQAHSRVESRQLDERIVRERMDLSYLNWKARRGHVALQQRIMAMLKI